MSDRMDGYEGELGATASPQPALVASLPEPVCAVSAHTGDGQAQGRGPYRLWKTTEIRAVRELRQTGACRSFIASELGRTTPSVKRIIERFRL